MDGRVTEYFRCVADARYVMRKVVRIVDEIAKRHDLDPLEHQALIQIFGARDDVLIRTVAERIDVPPTLASKLTKALITKKVVTARNSPNDSRASLLRVTAAGGKLLKEIDASVRVEVNAFTQGLTPAQKSAAREIFAFYVGSSVDMKESNSRAP